MLNRIISLTTAIALLVSASHSLAIDNAISITLSEKGQSRIGHRIEDIINNFGFGLRTTSDLGIALTPEGKYGTIRTKGNTPLSEFNYKYSGDDLLSRLPEEYNVFHEIYAKLSASINELRRSLERDFGKDSVPANMRLNPLVVGLGVEGISHELEFADQGFSLTPLINETEDHRLRLGLKSGIAMRLKLVIPSLRVDIRKIEFFDSANDFGKAQFHNGWAEVRPRDKVPLDVELDFFLHVDNGNIKFTALNPGDILKTPLEEIPIHADYEDLVTPKNIIMGKDMSDLIEYAINKSLHGPQQRIVSVTKMYLKHLVNNILPEKLKEITQHTLTASFKQKVYFQPPGAGKSLVEPFYYSFHPNRIGQFGRYFRLVLDGDFQDSSNGPFAHRLNSVFPPAKEPQIRSIVEQETDFGIAVHESFISQLFVLSFNRGYFEQVLYENTKEKNWFETIESQVACPTFYSLDPRRARESRNRAISLMTQMIARNGVPAYIDDEDGMGFMMGLAGIPDTGTYVDIVYNRYCEYRMVPDKEENLEGKAQKQVLAWLSAPPALAIQNGSHLPRINKQCSEPGYKSCTIIPARLSMFYRITGTLSKMPFKKNPIEIRPLAYIRALLTEENTLKMDIVGIDVEDFQKNDFAFDKEESIRFGMRSWIGKKVFAEIEKQDALYRREPYSLNTDFPLPNPAFGIGLDWKKITFDANGYVLFYGDFAEKGAM